MRLQLLAEHFALRHHLVQFVPADGFAERGLRAHVDRAGVVLHFQDGLLGIPDHPEDDGVHVYGDGVAGERGFGADVGDADALVDIAADAVDDRDEVKDTGSAQTDVAAEAEDCDPLPLVGHADGEQEVEADRQAGDGCGGSLQEGAERYSHSNRNDKQGHADGAGTEGDLVGSHSVISSSG